MSWTAPRTWVAGEVVTAALMNTHVRDDFRYLKGLDGTVTLDDGLDLGTNELTVNSLEVVGVDGIVNKEQLEDHTHADGDNGGTIDHGALTGRGDDDHTQYQKENLLTTQGDMPYATAASTWARLAKGTAGQNLRMNSGATAPEWVDAPSIGYKITKLTINYNDSSPVTVVNIPAGGFVVFAQVNITTTFTLDAGITGIGDAGNPDGFIASAQINADTTGWKVNTSAALGAYLYDAADKWTGKGYTSATDIIITLDATGVTQGVAVFYVAYYDLSIV